MTGTETSPQPDSIPVRVAHIADSCRHYPGELVTFYTRVEVWVPVPGFTLRITLPAGLSLEDYRAPANLDVPSGQLPWITLDNGIQNVIWKVEGQIEAPGRYEYQVAARVAATSQDRILESRAVVSTEALGGVASLRTRGLETLDKETATIAVSAQGRYLRYLPAIYQEDELMGRFLMLFESFWAPIEQQIDHLSLYFDPRMTPPDFLPWLASWINLVLDEGWPEERRRLLLRSAASLYRKRGTRRGLEEYLGIYTGGKAEIVEHRAHNLRLGPEARLGPAIALGKGNVPHTFTVLLRLPPVSSLRPSAAGGEEGHRARPEVERWLVRKIEAIIDAEKPAHTSYTLHVEEA
jgi:phage tail-like protein